MGKMSIRYKGKTIVLENCDLDEARKLYWSYFNRTGNFLHAVWTDLTNKVYL